MSSCYPGLTARLIFLIRVCVCVSVWLSCVHIRMRACVRSCIFPCISLSGSRPVFPAIPTSFLHSHGAQLSSNRTSVVRCGRQKYERQYLVLLVRPDGSTVSIRYQEPRRLLLVSGRQGLSVHGPSQRFCTEWRTVGFFVFFSIISSLYFWIQNHYGTLITEIKIQVIFSLFFWKRILISVGSFGAMCTCMHCL